MCAPNEPKMEEPSVWRSSSQSTGGTTLIGDNSVISPLASPPARHEYTANSVIFTGPDNKQWIDLDILSPKLVKELRRQNAWPGADNTRSIAKGAARIKAWARQSKLGIDIRLRRKMDEKHDEVTEFQLVPDFVRDAQGENKSALYMPYVAELPEDEVTELPDTSVAQELPARYFDTPSRANSASPFSEYLPQYEPSSVTNVGSGAFIPTADEASAFDLFPDGLYQPSDNSGAPDEIARPPSPTSSIVRTPTRGLSLSVQVGDLVRPAHHVPEGEVPGKGRNDEDVKEALDDEGTVEVGDAPDVEVARENEVALNVEEGSVVKETPESEGTSQSSLQALEAGLVETNKRLQEERQMREEFAKMIEDLKKSTQVEAQGVGSISKDDVEPQQAKVSAQTGSLLRGLRVAEKKTYETETDVEPPSSASSVRSSSISIGKGKKPRVLPRKKRSSLRSSSAIALPPLARTASKSTGSDDESSLLRRQTVPKKMQTGSDPEAIWYALLTAQKKILGAEHPLVFQAMHEFAVSRLEQHKNHSESILGALHGSKKEASRTLGEVHPWVTTYSADLDLLEKLIKQRAGIAEVTEIAAEVSPKSPAESSPDVAQDEEAGTLQVTKDQSLVRSPVSEEGNQLRETETPIPQAAQAAAALQQPELSPLQTQLPPSRKDPTPPPDVTNPWYNAYRPPHNPRNDASVLGGLTLAAMANMVINAAAWISRNYGPEPAVEAGKVRVRWTCSCGMQMHDDFVEKRRGAARELEAYLNRPRVHGNGGASPVSSASTPPSRVFTDSTGRTLTSQSTMSSFGNNQYSPLDKRGPRVDSGYGGLPQYQPMPEPPWLLTCANEDRYTPKLTHLDMSQHKITSDRDLAMALREHYFHINRRWWRTLKLRGLTTVEFVQFEVHQNKFADIRKCPDMPPIGSSDYDFEPGELLPPVGSNYLLHLFKHPEDYDGELITYLRSPKKHGGRLQLGVGWGINLVEGFLPARVWALLGGFFALGSFVFGTVWAYLEKDLQGAFGVAAWIVTLAGLAVGYLQASLG